MKRFFFLLVAAVALVTWASARWQPEPIEERLVRIRAAEAFPKPIGELAGEPIEVLATLVDFADDRVLLLKAQAALLRHPRLAREILPLYGQEPEFREILRTYGEAVLLPIDYFLRNEVRTIAFAHALSRRASQLNDAVSRWRGSGTERADDDAVGVAPALGPLDRGWYAVHFVRDEGHDFLGQFVLDADGNTQWIQTERVLEAMNMLFASGVRSLETKARTGVGIGGADLGWAAVDGLAIVGATALLRAGRAAGSATKAATSVRAAPLSTRAAAYSAHVAKAARIGVRSARYAKWPAIAATAYIVVRHPSIIGDALSGLADVIGWPRWVVLGIGWTLILLPVFLLGRFVWRATGWLLRATTARPQGRPVIAAQR